MPIADDRLAELLRLQTADAQTWVTCPDTAHARTRAAEAEDLAAALRELQAYRAEADDEHPVGLSLRERVAGRMEA